MVELGIIRGIECALQTTSNNRENPAFLLVFTAGAHSFRLEAHDAIFFLCENCSL
jgi:hypothetical protein